MSAARVKWGDFIPMDVALMRSKYSLPWCLAYEHDEQRSGFWVKYDPNHKNTVSDPRDQAKLYV